MKNVITHSEKETFNLARDLAGSFKGGEVVGLSGNLGAGKTIFAKGLARGLGIKKTVNSPTFNIMKIYDIPKKAKLTLRFFCHIDAYRINASDLINLGAEDYFERKDTVIVVEWSKKIIKILPEKTIRIMIKPIKGGAERSISISGL
jgi:tRNA threonylcarbamoyladenosine biosynthesis protein TsaE